MDSNKKSVAYRVIFLLGLVSLFGDITYEGARGVIGPYLSFLGASAVIVGLITGVGEFIGYALRLLFGYLSDRTERYWLFTFLGYGMLLAIPFLAFAGYWEVAFFLVIMERMGKALRSPARDVILSYSTKQVGRGFGFGIHEAMDQIGAIAGPLLFSLVIFISGRYEVGFLMLFIPVAMTMGILTYAYRKVPAPEKLESDGMKSESEGEKIPRVFWVYSLFIFFSIAGFANFQIISYHLKFKSVVPESQIPLLYAIAMAVDAGVALIVGRFYDRVGIMSLALVPALIIPIPFLGFSLSYMFVVIAVILWGSVMGIQETVMRASIADMVPIRRRGLAYGVFNTIFGLAWFVGSVVIGMFYDIEIVYVFVFSCLMEILSIIILLFVRRELRHKKLGNLGNYQ